MTDDLGVIVRTPIAHGYGYFALDTSAIADWRWTPDLTEAWVFTDDYEAAGALLARQIEVADVEIVSAAMTAETSEGR
jgi:hypothetical protein